MSPAATITGSPSPPAAVSPAWQATPISARPAPMHAANARAGRAPRGAARCVTAPRLELDLVLGVEELSVLDIGLCPKRLEHGEVGRAPLGPYPVGELHPAAVPDGGQQV